MRYFENTLRLRIDPKEKYKAHQLIDTLMQERLQIKLPYSWRSVPYPGAEHYSAVQIRSSVATGLPGEKELSISFKSGDIVQFTCNLCSVIRVRVNEDKKQHERIGSSEQVVAKLKKHAARFGLEVLSCVEESDEPFNIKKPKNAVILLGQRELSVVARILDVSLAEKTLIEGIGNKRIFGFGYIWGLEVL
ncbi:type I-E CRISPR-associated protein Cas6/Cse3/CasE [Rheinheimera sp.]|uniref:type I-E CRISPR-associated protein Cas6/Cse3/CasE n=1 Tax=Rheinheimera sp. TaxID=1869214 RepID=UPI00404891B4